MAGETHSGARPAAADGEPSAGDAWDGARLRDLPHAVGRFSQRRFDDSGAELLAGWLTDPRDGPYDAVPIFVDGEPAGTATPRAVPGVARSAPWIPDVARSGCAFPLELPSEDRPRPRRVQAIGVRDGAPAGRFETVLRSRANEELPLPPVAIAVPSTDGRSAEFAGDAWTRRHLRSALSTAASLLDRIEVHSSGPGGLRLLDWGCGTGRVTRHLLGEGLASISGCDIDRGAIEWCQGSLPGISFSPSDLEPPLPYEDESFDVVVGCSVMTHLDAARQASWLEEIRRITAPGGLALLSTQGDFAYRWSVAQSLGAVRRLRPAARLALGALGRRLARRGFVDRGAMRALTGIAPHGYYRAVAQTPAYTRDAWSPFFEVLEIVEGGLGGHQDLVVMRRG